MTRFGDEEIDKKLDFQREMLDRQAVASGNVDENSALYRHAKLNGWDLGGGNELHGPARANAVAARRDQERMLSAQADMAESQADAMRGSGVGGFGVDWDGNMTSYNEDATIRDGFDGIVAGANMAQADRARRGRVTLSSLYGHALKNGRMVPASLGPSVGQELGQPGFVGGTILPDGTFMSLGRGKDGRIKPTGLVPVQGVGRAAVQSGDVQTANAIYNQFLKGKFTDRQIEQMTGYSERWAQQAAAKDRQRRMAQAEKIIFNQINAILKEKPEASPNDAWHDLVKTNPRALDYYLTRPAEGDEVGDENGNVRLDAKDGYKKFEETWNAAKSGNTKAESSGNQRFDQIGALLDRLERMNAPAPRDPNVVATEQRNAARTNVINAAGGKQQLVYERLPNGQLAYSNGYVVNGRVYDANGDERKGEFYDEHRRRIEPAAAQTPAQAAQTPRNGASAAQAQGGTAAPGGLPGSVSELNGASATQTPAQENPERAKRAAEAMAQRKAASAQQTPANTQPPAAQRTKLAAGGTTQSGGQVQAQNAASKDLRAENNKLKGTYEAIPQNVMNEFRTLYPDVNNAEINTGKHDQELRNIANYLGDKSTAKMLDWRDERRSRREAEAKNASRREENRRTLMAEQNRFESFQREKSALEKSLDASRRRMRAQGTYNEDLANSIESSKLGKLRSKYGLAADGSEDSVGSLTYRNARSIVDNDERQAREEQPHHKVSNGETLEDIAELYNTDVTELMRLNGMDETDEIHVGDNLIVPPDYDEDYDD